MGILPDYAIARDVKITPLVKYDRQEQLGKVSWGLGSYGYDARIGYKFRVFKPFVPGCANPVIDPLDFNPGMLEEVDYSPSTKHDFQVDPDTDYSKTNFDYKCIHCGDRAKSPRDSGLPCKPKPPNHILIPPHSFALGETVEHFDIPRDVLCVVVGKSTYARCFSGDTRVMLANGSNPTFQEMAAKPNRRRWGFGVDRKSGRIEMTELTLPRFVSKENLVRVTLDNGEHIDCTPDHKFLRHGGYYTAAEDLIPGNGVVSIYERIFRGRRTIWVPHAKTWLPAHWFADNWNLEHGIYGPTPNTHRHHKDDNKRNDNPTNIVRKDAKRHIQDHNAAYYGEGFDHQLHSLLIRNALAEKMKDPEWVKYVRKLNKEKAEKFWTAAEFAEKREEVIEALRASWNQERREEHAHRMKEYNKTVSFEDRQRRWSPERKRKQAEVMARVNAKLGKGNHTVVKIEALKGLHETFCVTSNDTGNFTLANNVVVKNCGLIVNVTPGEPEWRGKWTVEISNTTPLPAKVYCGQGIFQAMFFRSDGYRELSGNLRVWQGGIDPDVVIAASCDVSYADKKGKYQDQTGLTNPTITKKEE